MSCSEIRFFPLDRANTVEHPLEDMLHFKQDDEKIKENIIEAMHSIGGNSVFEIR